MFKPSIFVLLMAFLLTLTVDISEAKGRGGGGSRGSRGSRGGGYRYRGSSGGYYGGGGK